MKTREFFDKVAEMRRLQKEYFRTRSPYLLRESKKMEGKIDAEIKRVRDIMQGGPGLFENTDGTGRKRSDFERRQERQ